MTWMRAPIPSSPASPGPWRSSRLNATSSAAMPSRPYGRGARSASWWACCSRAAASCARTRRSWCRMSAKARSPAEPSHPLWNARLRWHACLPPRAPAFRSIFAASCTMRASCGRRSSVTARRSSPERLSIDCEPHPDPTIQVPSPERRMSNVPSDLKYTKSHEWLRTLPDGTVEVGITDHAQHALGDLVFVEVPEAGRKLTAGEAFAVVESVKAASDVYSPVTGEVTASNAALASEPEAINSDSYGKGWLMRLRPVAPRAPFGRGVREADRGGGWLMAFIPHTREDVEAMLAAIGVDSIEQLFDEIPANLRLSALAGVPEALSEMEIGRLMAERARLDGRPLCFIGAGAYEHHIPAAVWAIATRGEFYSAYTPYQAEASQGTLQLLYEYQTMMASLTGMDVSNASMYDGASAMGEASLMAVRANRRSRSQRILVPSTVSPY